MHARIVKQSEFLYLGAGMVSSFLLSLREGLEAALIIGIVLAALRKTGRPGLITVVWRGVGAAVIASLLAGLVLTWLGTEFEGRGEQIFEGSAMLLAAILLTWMIFWMQRQSVHMQNNLEAGVSLAVQKDNPWTLFWLAFLAVAREGLELVLFLVAAQMASSAFQTSLGAILGLFSAILLGWILFSSSKRLNIGQFFLVINLLLIFFSAGLLARSIHEFNEAGIIPSIIEHIWDLNPILNQQQPVGQLLTTLFGYNASPSLSEALAYLAYFLGLGILWKSLKKKSVQTPAP
jgi:high-affinity iron transporter